ncbi:MAG TPA: Clp protease N-terminal domain-containing protein, partial [Trueperaceae bacterium]|nr:Clp protease N-terminal domain-containing protein [Trueperaceae bacterium]
MDAERFTEAALQLVASAQQVARTRQNQQVGPLHLAASLLADPSGLPSRVVERAGADPEAARSTIDAGLAKLPVVSGADGQFMSPVLGNAFTRAEELAKEWQDAFVAADTLLVALRDTAGKELDALPPARALEEAAKAIRGGQNVDSRTAESTFEALETYG